MFKIIELTQDEIALVDMEDFNYISQWKWWVKRDHSTDYAVRLQWDSELKKDKGISLHRVLMERILGYPIPPGMEVHHINDFGLDDRRKNLLLVTIQQHQFLHRTRSSKYPGVSYHKPSGKWQANISLNGKQNYLGLFLTEVRAYDEWKAAARLEMLSQEANNEVVKVI